MSGFFTKFRFKYFFGHLVISFAIALLSLYLVFYVWYPAPLDKAAGVSGIILIMLSIDVMLGPLLTLVLAKEGKKGLKFDLIVIAIVQLLALSYGLYSVDKGRPVAIAFDINRFELVLKNNIKTDEHWQIIKQFADNQGNRIPAVSIRPAKDDEEYAKRMKNELELGIIANANPELYETVAQNIEIIKKEMKPIQDLPKFNDQVLAEQIMAQYPQADGFLPLFSPDETQTVLIDSKNKVFVAVVDARPW